MADGGSVVDSPDDDLFISYARADNKTEFVSRLFDTIYEDFREFSSEPFKRGWLHCRRSQRCLTMGRQSFAVGMGVIAHNGRLVVVELASPTLTRRTPATAAYPDPLPGVDPPCSTTRSFRRGAIGAIEGHETNTIDCDGRLGYLGADGGRVHAALGQRWADVHSCRSRIAITGLHLRSWLPLGPLPWSMRA